MLVLQDRFQTLHKCISTNGLLLPESIFLLKELGVETITVTINAVDPAISARIYSFIYYQGEKLEGRQAAEVLLHNQLAGIERAVKEGIAVKVNTVMIPTINDNHIIEFNIYS